MTALILHSLLDLYKYPRIPVDDPETNIYRIDLLVAIEEAYKQELISSAQVQLLNAYLSGYSIAYLSARNKNAQELLQAALKAIAALSIDYQDDRFVQKYKDQYKVSAEYLKNALEKLGNDLSVIKEIENNELEFNIN